MTIENRIKHLQDVHDDLDKEIDKKVKQYGNDTELQNLKKKKLHLKDEIEHHKKTLESKHS
jgi:hypothetical protein